MRYAILGDIHSNLSALETVLSAIEAKGVDRILSVGDVVGYGAAPHEVMQILRELDTVVVKGNHDAACVDELDTKFFNPYAREAVEWTRAQLSTDELNWLRNLPLTVDLDDCTIAHGSLHQPEQFEYIQCTEDADPSLDEMERPVCFVGHTHVPVAIMRMADDPLRTSYSIDCDIDLTDVSRALINVGSVGQPRDEDSRAPFGIYDSDKATFSIERVEYDIAREAQRIRDAGLAGILADRLFLGV